MHRTIGTARALYRRAPACILRAAPFTGTAASRGRLFATGAALVGSATALAIASCDSEAPSLDAASSQLHSAVGVYSANDPIEDRHVMKETARGDFIAAVFGEWPTAQSAFFQNFTLGTAPNCALTLLILRLPLLIRSADGHGGWQAAEFAQKRLTSVLQAELTHSLAKSTDQITAALTRTFLRLEREWLHQVKSAFDLGFGSCARTGACALVALVREDDLFVANAGDCRAVLGRRATSSNGSGANGAAAAAERGVLLMEAVALSNDHNAREPVEQAKLRALHPFEADIIKYVVLHCA
jgi:Protein phosphatase 2C